VIFVKLHEGNHQSFSAKPVKFWNCGEYLSCLRLAWVFWQNRASVFGSGELLCYTQWQSWRRASHARMQPHLGNLRSSSRQ